MTGAIRRRHLIASAAVILLLALVILAWRLSIASHRPSLQEWVQKVKRPGDEELYAAVRGSRYVAVLYHMDEIIVCDSELTSNGVSTVEIIDKRGESVTDESRRPDYLTRTWRIGPFLYTTIDGLTYPIHPDSKDVRVIYSLGGLDINGRSGRDKSVLIDVEVSLKGRHGAATRK